MGKIVYRKTLDKIGACAYIVGVSWQSFRAALGQAPVGSWVKTEVVPVVFHNGRRGFRVWIILGQNVGNIDFSEAAEGLGSVWYHDGDRGRRVFFVYAAKDVILWSYHFRFIYFLKNGKLEMRRESMKNCQRRGRPPVPPRSNLGVALREWAAGKGWSDARVAEVAGVASRTWRAWLAGERRPDRRSKKTLKEAGFSVEKFL